MKDFSVTIEDLQANRAGKLSPAQRADMQNQHRHGWIVIGVILILLVGVIYLGITLLQSRVERPEAQLRNIVIGVVAFSSLLLYVRIQHQKVGWDLRSGTVKASQGTLRLSKDKARYQAQVSATPFRISEALFLALSELQRTSPQCTLYYTPRSLTVVAYEPMQPGK